MTRTRNTAAAALLAGALLLAGCGSGGDGHDNHPLDEGGPADSSLTTPPPPPLPGAFAGVDQNDPESVMVGAAQALFSYAPAEEANQLAAAQRAAPLFDERYYSENSGSFIALAPITGKQWQSWADEGAIVTASASVTSDEHPADQPAKVSRVLAVTQTATTPEGKPLSSTTFAAYMSATKLGVWRVSAVAVR
ncbi:hypothetical protein LRL17_30400 (plasmid) [Rhodococcus qingshengii]|uniref:hypothetical protein n=1 Tax=Rhodococcus TaxID=1827 RepID=UPI00110DCC51|nr:MULTISPECIES: hypothetical protein [Rhodococcus]TSD39711.1 hypothetical protein FFI94_033480 [Rhodococcus sp. KBS0724]UGQ55214.1 hypothetical protein LRL17_30400 [Rhodococcus qingshengii]